LGASVRAALRASTQIARTLSSILSGLSVTREL
jgi:hypothetical protein